MATRWVEGVLRRQNGKGWAGGKVGVTNTRFATAAETVPEDDNTYTATANGVLKFPVYLPNTGSVLYRFTLPDNSSFEAWLSDGVGSIDFDLLALGGGIAPENPDTVQSLIDATIAATVLDDLADVYIPVTPTNGQTLAWSAANARFELASGGGGGGASDVAELTAGAWDDGESIEWDEDAEMFVPVSYMKKSGGTFTGTVLFPNGTNAAPSISFASDPDSGLRHFDADAIAMVLGGQARFLFINGASARFITGQTEVGVGTAAAPTHTFNADTDTGMFNLPPNELGLSAGGRLAARLSQGQTVFAGSTTHRIEQQADSSTTQDQKVGATLASWATNTHASRKGRVRHTVSDFGGDRDYLIGEASGSVPMIGFLGATPVARQVVTGSRGGNKALENALAAEATAGLITDSTTSGYLGVVTVNDSETAISHGLSYIPTQILITPQGLGMVVESDATPADATKIYLIADDTGRTAKVWVS
jgi:hypothetical protein